jgi:hypothetical protein
MTDRTPWARRQWTAAMPMGPESFATPQHRVDRWCMRDAYAYQLQPPDNDAQALPCSVSQRAMIQQAARPAPRHRGACHLEVCGWLPCQCICIEPSRHRSHCTPGTPISRITHTSLPDTSGTCGPRGRGRRLLSARLRDPSRPRPIPQWSPRIRGLKCVSIAANVYYHSKKSYRADRTQMEYSRQSICVVWWARSSAQQNIHANLQVIITSQPLDMCFRQEI